MQNNIINNFNRNVSYLKAKLILDNMCFKKYNEGFHTNYFQQYSKIGNNRLLNYCEITQFPWLSLRKCVVSFILFYFDMATITKCENQLHFKRLGTNMIHLGFCSIHFNTLQNLIQQESFMERLRKWYRTALPLKYFCV